MKLNRIALSLAPIALILLMASTVSTAFACVGPGLSPGYWKHNVKVYNGGPGNYSGDPKETDVTMEHYEEYIINYYKTDFTLEWANEMFQNNANKDQWLTIANWFNAAADRSPYTSD